MRNMGEKEKTQLKLFKQIYTQQWPVTTRQHQLKNSVYSDKDP